MKKDTRTTLFLLLSLILAAPFFLWFYNYKTKNFYVNHKYVVKPDSLACQVITNKNWSNHVRGLMLVDGMLVSSSLYQINSSFQNDKDSLFIWEIDRPYEICKEANSAFIEVRKDSTVYLFSIERNQKLEKWRKETYLSED
jgi:hypothetical protein